MATETWGLMPKAQNDDQTIDEAIASAISDHEADPEAHQGEGESLQNHKSDSVIDHPEESIVQDKYAPFSIPAIKFDYTKRIIAPQFESLDSWEHGSNGEDLGYAILGGYALDVNGISGNYAYIHPTTMAEPINFATKNPMQDIGIRLSQTTNQTLYAMCGYYSGNWPAFGFKIVNDTIYACWRKSGTEYTQSLATFTANEMHRYRAQYIAGTGIEFYIDNELLYTATTNLPTNTANVQIFSCRLTTNADESKSAVIITPTLIYDF